MSGSDRASAGKAHAPQILEGERPTLKTIAYLTGLGVTTVSRALKDAPDIGADTKERVRLVARQLGYQPNRAGVRLRTGKTNVIALVLGMDAEIMSMTGRMVYGISEVLTGTPYHLVLTPHISSADPMVPVRYIAETGSADGVILSRTEPDDTRIRFLTERNIPFVTHGRTEMGLTHPYHDFDNEAFAYKAVERLAARGRKRLAILPPPKQLTYSGHTMNGFRRGLRDYGLEEVPFDGIDIEVPAAEQKDAVENLMRGANAPDGLICCSGSSAIAAAAGIASSGKAIGREIDMAAKESAGVLPWFQPQIIAMNEDFTSAGRELARALLARIAGADPTSWQSIATSTWTDET
ncbi:LacI family transcriptional regulator [Rhizobium sp. C1]|uniref:LacI family transcriptional regulator n=1 Tax=Rhizobium sp. C1 TaxID=1349799 RepID=UPI001E627738|nr:LacI family transcriptional regulator [Rhizobium sp. C1]MCD2176765.1 LacI family transcriptional regulator [Rhizobium sp. C1]